MDFEATYKNLERLGYHPTLSRGDFGTTTFYLEPKAKRIKVNIFPKGKYQGIQVAWNCIEEMKKHEKRLLHTLIVFPSAYVKTLSLVDFSKSKHMVINLKIPYNEKLLNKIDVAYSDYMREQEKSKSILDRLFH